MDIAPALRRLRVGASQVVLIQEDLTMARVMIRCPQTGKLVFTFITMDKKAFETATLHNMDLTCPACGQLRHWKKEDAILEGEPPPA